LNRKKFTGLFVIIIAVVVIIKLFTFFEPGNIAGNSGDINIFKGRANLVLTKHAKCRMECRHITIDEIKEILQNGHENDSKSGQGRDGAKTYALEGFSSDNQHIRVIVAPENEKLVVITCIDIDKDWPCRCN
jgi:hypothetical protein